MALRILAGFDTAEHGALKFSGRNPAGGGGYTETTVAAGTYCHESMASISGASEYTSFGTVAAAAMTVALGGTVTPSWNTSTLRWTFSRGSASDWKIGADEADEDIARLGRFLGFSTSVLNQSSITSDVAPWFLLEGAMGAKSAVTDDYEPDGITTEAEANSGASYATAWSAAPTYHDFKLAMESQAATFKRHATGANPYTFQHFVEHVRNIHPFWVKDDVDSTVHKLRGKSASFKPTREVADYDDLWHWPFDTRVVGR